MGRGPGVAPRWAKGDNEHAKYTVSSVIFVAQVAKPAKFGCLFSRVPQVVWEFS